jgi:hypothetical protein
MSNHSPKAIREKMAAIAEELRAAGIHEWRDTTIVGNSHIRLEFEYAGKRQQPAGRYRGCSP